MGDLCLVHPQYKVCIIAAVTYLCKCKFPEHDNVFRLDLRDSNPRQLVERSRPNLCARQKANNTNLILVSNVQRTFSHFGFSKVTFYLKIVDSNFSHSPICSFPCKQIARVFDTQNNFDWDNIAKTNKSLDKLLHKGGGGGIFVSEVIKRTFIHF